MGKKDDTCDAEGAFIECGEDVCYECAFEWCDVACCSDHYDNVMFECVECFDTHCYSHGYEELRPEPGAAGGSDDLWITVHICDDCQP